MSLACWPVMLLWLLKGSSSAANLPGIHSFTLVNRHCHGSPPRGISMQEDVQLSRERRANWPSWFLLNWIMSQAVARESLVCVRVGFWERLARRQAVRGLLIPYFKLNDNAKESCVQSCMWGWRILWRADIFKQSVDSEIGFPWCLCQMTSCLRVVSSGRHEYL